jgi:hypothetical protein
MCFSATADLVGGAVVGAIGLDVVLHVNGRRSYRALAALPLLFAVHQLVESVVWSGADGSWSPAVRTAALWVYLLFAFVVLPTYVPWATWRIEPPGTRRVLMAWITVIGVGVSLSLLVAMLAGPVTVRAHEYHLAYTTSLRAGTLVVALYVFATCGAFILSGQRLIMWFGGVNLLAVGILATTVVDGFASLWCAWAAVTSAAFAIYLRREDPELFTGAASLVR